MFDFGSLRGFHWWWRLIFGLLQYLLFDQLVEVYGMCNLWYHLSRWCDRFANVGCGAWQWAGAGRPASCIPR